MLNPCCHLHLIHFVKSILSDIFNQQSITAERGTLKMHVSDILGNKLNMTAPVLNVRSPNSVRMCFMVPSKYSENPPTPTDSEVSIYSMKGQVYVRLVS